MVQIRTKWHVVKEAMTKKQVFINTPADDEQGPVDQEDIYMPLLEDMVTIIDSLPKFYVEDQLMRMINRPDVVASIKAIHEAGLARLPFKDLLVEYDQRDPRNGESYRVLIMLSERGSELYDYAGLGTGMPFRANVMRFNHANHQVTLGNCTIYLSLEDMPEGFGFKSEAGIAGYLNETLNTKRWGEHTGNQEAQIAGIALGAMVLLLHTKGIMREPVESGRLNKARQRSGKPPIPHHVVIRVGHVYDKAGRAIGAGTGKTGRKMPVHLRRAHMRTQKYGPGRTLEKKVFIEAILVNYTEGDDIPVPEVTVTW